MTSGARRLVLGLGWVAVAFGILGLAGLPGDYTHALCGVWG
jgi:hypothetical protein